MIRNFIRNFMIGRYGPDHFGTALIVVSLLLSLIFRLTGLEIGALIAYIPLLYAMFRMLSRNIAARRRENDKYLRFWAPLKARVKRRITTIKGMKTHKFFKCPGCRNTLRVPRGRGKLQITCPRCGERFIKKS